MTLTLFLPFTLDGVARLSRYLISVLNHNLAENAPPLSAEPLRYNNNPRIKEDDPSVAEIRDAIKSLPNNKTTGIDPKQSVKWLHPLIKDAWEN